jgi:hypothetical protein
MKRHVSALLAGALWLALPPATAQQTPAQPEDATQPQDAKPQDAKTQDRFWQATLPGGHYMVALDRISAISRHKYVLDGTVIVDEVTIDALGQALARFYHIQPITSAAGGGAAGQTAAKLGERGQEVLDRAAAIAGTDLHQMVIKKFPETTHAHTIEYRLMSEEQLAALHQSARTAWETGRGRKFSGR